MSGQLSSLMRAISGRFVHSVVTLWLVTVLFFVIAEFMPGDFATATATRDTTRAVIEATRFELGLYTSAPQRYLEWLTGLLTGNLGESWWLRRPITDFIGERLWHSAWLVGWATAVTVPLSLLLALIAVAWHRGVFDRASSTIALTAMSFPDFLIAYGLMSLLTVKFQIFPVFTIYKYDMTVVERLHASALPILSLAAVTVTPMFRLSRAALISVMSTEYVQTAYLKGLGRWRVLLKHALPNAIGPIANAIVLSLANLFFGLIIIEGIFQYPGMGHLLLTSVSNRDIPLVQACALLAAAVYIGFNLIADLVGILNNPRLRYPSVPAETRWIRKEWIDALTANWKLTTAAAALCLTVIFGVSTYLAERVENTVWSKIATPTETKRSKLTIGELLSATPDLREPVHYDYFRPFGNAEPAKHSLEGQLRIPRFTARRRRADQEFSTATGTFPAIETNLVRHGDVLLPLERDILRPASSGSWYVILSAGRVWHEPDDGDWSRAALPFTITGLRAYAAHYGVLTFMFNDQSISRVRVQIAQETGNWAQYDLWGQVEASLNRKALPGAEQARAAYDKRRKTNLDVRPWGELAAKHWRSLEFFDGKGNRENVAASGLMVDDTVYLRPCRTRAGPHPFCREMRYGVFSVSKTLGAAISMLWLAEKFGPEVFNQKITDYVSIPARHDGWSNVTFGNALDMTSGIGDVTPYRVDQYVEADQTRKGNRVWYAASIREKLDGIAHFNNYPWGPGEVTRYRSTDTTALTAAMEAYLRRREGPDADLWRSLTEQVFRPLGIDRLPVRRSVEPDGRPGTPLLAGGMYPTIEEALKLARLMQDHGEFNGRQLLHRELTKRAVSNDMARGFPTGWRYAEGGEAHYEMSLWLTPHKSGWFCKVRLPGMAGFGGNYVFIMPNRTIGLRFADGHDDDPHTWNSYGIRRISDRVRPFCP